MINRYLIVLSGFLMLTSSCKFESRDPYIQAVKRARFSKDSFYKVADQSPFDIKGKRELIELKYYEPDSTYRVMAKLNVLAHPDSFQMHVSNGHDQDYFKLGTISFRLKGHDGRLSIYQSAKMMKDSRYQSDLFVPFTDETNGKETYTGGRFIELTRINGSDNILLDFNYCYNPYCAYNHDYSCPIPPEENHLNFKVEAGEKAYKLGDVTLFK